jgi:hypothetical protein
MSSRVRLLTSTAISARGSQRCGGDRLIDESSHWSWRLFFFWFVGSTACLTSLRCGLVRDFHRLFLLCLIASAIAAISVQHRLVSKI